MNTDKIVISSIGETAGLIWNYLKNSPEPVNVTQLKIQLSLTASALHLALGWLARENKVQLEQIDRVLFVSLKK